MQDPPSMDGAARSLLEGLGSAFTSAKYTDLTITCDGRVWQVHKAVLCSMSEFFRTACDSDFKEAKENKIDLAEHDPQVVEAMLKFMYRLDYGTPNTRNDESMKLAFHAQVCAIAEAYIIQDLQAAAEKNYLREALTLWSTPAFPNAIVYSGTSKVYDGLKSILVNVTVDHAVCLFTPNHHVRFQQVAADTPEFAAAVAKRLTGILNQRPDTYECLTCRMPLTIGVGTGTRSAYPNAYYTLIAKAFGTSAFTSAFTFYFLSKVFRR